MSWKPDDREGREAICSCATQPGEGPETTSPSGAQTTPAPSQIDVELAVLSRGVAVLKVGPSQAVLSPRQLQHLRALSLEALTVLGCGDQLRAAEAGGAAPRPPRSRLH